MEHTNLFLYATQQELVVDYPDGRVDNPIPGVAYARDEGTVLFNKKKVSYTVTVNYQDRSGNTLAESTTVHTPEALEGASAKVVIYPAEVEGAKPVSPTQKITVTADTAYTFLYYILTSYTITVNHMFSGESIASSTTVVVDNVYELDIVPVTIEPINIEGYIAQPVTIRVSGVCEYNLEYEEQSGCYVDLGLPSGTLWACNNVGAENPEDVGYLFAWGEIEPKATFTLENYRFYDGGAPRRETMECSSNYTKYTHCDGLNALELVDDAAYVHLGEGWHIPTSMQWLELLDYTTLDYESVNGCVVLTSNVNGNELVLPIYMYNSQSQADPNCVGWTKDRDIYNDYSPDENAYLSHLGCETYLGPESVNKSLGAPVRPVIGEGPQPSPDPEEMEE